MKCVDYIPVIKEQYDSYARLNVPYFIPARKVRIKEIVIDKKFVPNPLCEETVTTIFEFFDEWNWMPILIDENYNLLDGQHRIEFAKRLGLKYIDAVIQNSVIFEEIEAENAKRKRNLKNRRTCRC